MKTNKDNERGGLRGPERFEGFTAEEPETNIFAVGGAILALLALVVAVPVMLVWWQGLAPVPTSLPTRETLTQPITTELLFAVLAAVVWLAWLQFTICVVAEVKAVLRGGRLAVPVPLSGKSQALARILVGTALVGSLVAGGAGSASATETAAPITPGTSTSQATTQDASSPVTAAPTTPQQSTAVGGQVGVQGGAPTASSQVSSTDSPTDPRIDPNVAGVPDNRADLVGKKVVVVKPPEGRYHDNLWDIAERHLDDGRRWKEIFELNKGRTQPDGGELVIGRLIQPGWLLIMPEDAQGVARVDATEGGASESGGAERGGVESGVADQSLQDLAEAGGVEAGAVGGAALSAVDRAGDTSAGDQSGGIDSARAADEARPSGGGQGAVIASNWNVSLLGGGLAAAGLLLGLQRERRARRSARLAAQHADVEVALRVGADLGRAQRLDRALRQLATACASQGIPLPPVYAAMVTDDAVELLLGPGVPAAPHPWEAQDQGRRWVLTRTVADGDSTALGSAPYPGLVCLGRDIGDDADVLIDLASIGAPLSVTGADLVTHEFVSALAVQLMTAPWIDSTTVHGYALDPRLTDIAGERFRAADDMQALVAELRDTGGSSHVGRRVASASGDVDARYVVLGGGVTPGDLDQLRGVTETGNREIGVIAATRIPHTRWAIQIDERGHLSLPLLGLEVEAVRLSGDSVDRLAGLFAQARRATPPSALHDLDVPDSIRPGDDAHWTTASARVGVLGPVSTRVTGFLEPQRMELASEMVTFLALQAEPVHPNVLAGSIWPRGVTAEVRDAAIARLRGWLGVDAAGNYLLREDSDGRLFLADDVAVDWAAFCVLADRAKRVQPRESVELLGRALQLVRGPFLDQAPTDRYSWVPRTGLEATVAEVVESVAHRLATLRAEGQDRDGAAAAARAGLRAVPTSQLLWRDLLRVAHTGDPIAGAAVVDEMWLAMSAVGAELESETEALIDDLMPGQGRRRSVVSF